MIKIGASKRVLWTIFLLAIASGCSQTSISDDREAICGALESKSESVEEKPTRPITSSRYSDVMWEDLRIQKLLPGYMIFPGIEPYLPSDFVALTHPKDHSVYWGNKENLETFFEKGCSCSHLKSGVICVDISTNMAQIDEDNFSNECSVSALEAEGMKNVIRKKWKWGIHPVMSIDGTMEGLELNIAWIGLNDNGQVLFARLVYPNEHGPSTEDLAMWSDFLKKTKPLGEHDFFKAHGQDLREGFTLINVYGSVLKVSAEKRTRDGKIQVNIKPSDDRISCTCQSVAPMLMGAFWHFGEPILKIPSRIQVISDANIVSDQIITVLIKEVSEFSDMEESYNASAYSRTEHGNVSVFNFSSKELGSTKSDGVILNRQQDAIYTSYGSEEGAIDSVNEFLRAAEGDPNLMVVDVKFEQEKVSESVIAYKAIITCQFSKPEDLQRIEQKAFKKYNNLIEGFSLKKPELNPQCKLEPASVATGDKSSP